jgi:flagellar basal-body rod modification protein FlgD
MSSVSALSGTSATTSTQTSSTDKSLLNSEDFLQLLTVQLQNQDPFDPMSDTEFISQMANFSSLEEMSTLSDNFSTFSARQEQLSAQAYLGKQVTVPGSDGDVTGLVSAVSLASDGSVSVTVDGAQYDISDISVVTLASESAE